MYKYKLFSFFCILSAVTEAEASRIKVVNQNLLPLMMEIVPELDLRGSVLYKRKDTFPFGFLTFISPNRESNEGPLCQSNIASICDITRENFAEFIISSEHLHGHQHFAVNGKSGSIFSGGSCRNLSTLKDYQIIFLNDDIGTTCVSEEIEPALFSSVFAGFK